MKRCLVPRRSSSILLVAFAIGLSTETANSNSQVEILRAGTYFEQDLSLGPTSGWWGLFRTNNGIELLPTPISIVPDTTLDGVFGQSPMRKVQVTNGESLIVLVKGLENPKSGPVESSFDVPSGRFLYPGEKMYLNLESGDAVQLYALGRAVTQDSHDLVIIHDYSLHVRRGYEDAGQTIFTADIVIPGGPPYLQWSGDLDRDGQVDLFFDLTNHEVGNNYTLFLSTPSSAEIVKRVASWSVTGC